MYNDDYDDIHQLFSTNIMAILDPRSCQEKINDK